MCLNKMYLLGELRCYTLDVLMLPAFPLLAILEIDCANTETNVVGKE